jgi:triacylglycerol esterase/lipase EstA (alpha/beta hydrolase family)
VYQDILLKPDRGFEQSLHEHTRRVWFTAQPKPSEGIGCLVVLSEDMMKLETIEFFLQPPYLLPVCHDAGVVIVRLSHYLVDDELRVSADVKLRNPKFGGDAPVIDQGLILRHIVGSAEVQSNNIKESISLRRD